MAKFNFIIRYVKSPKDSEAFYTSLLGRPAVESAPTFAMVPLDGGVMLGLWARDKVQPAAAQAGSDGEIALVAEGRNEVDDLHTRWRDQGVVIAQAPQHLDFGYTFTALDPDGLRIRVFAPEQSAA